MDFFNCDYNNNGTKLQPWVNDYIGSDFVNDVGIGVAIFIITLFITIVVIKALSRAVTWTGLGSIDKTFGIFFGIFKDMLFLYVYFLY